MINSSLLFVGLKKKKNRIIYSFCKNISGVVAIEAGFVLPLFVILLVGIFMISMNYMKYRSMDIMADDITRRWIYPRIASAKNFTNVAAFQADLCAQSSFFMLDCSKAHVYIDAYNRGKFKDVKGLESVFAGGGALKASWLKKNNALASGNYFSDNMSDIFIVRIGYPGTQYVGISIIQGH